MVSIHVEGETVKEVQDAMHKLLYPNDIVQSRPETEHGRANAKSDADTKVTRKAKESTPAPANAPKSDENSFTQIANTISALVAKVGKPETVKILAEFGVKKGSELKPEQYGAFIDRAHQALS